MTIHNLSSSRAAVAAALLVAAAGAASAQQPAAEAPPSAAPSAAPTPAPTPLPLLAGPAYETLRALSAGLAAEMDHVLQGAQEAVDAGRPARLYLPGIRMFKRRAEWFRDRVESYRAQPFDVVGAASMMNARAQMLSRRGRRNPALQSTSEDWDAALDILGRIKGLLAGETVTVPPPHRRRPAAAPAQSPLPAPSTAPSPR